MVQSARLAVQTMHNAPCAVYYALRGTMIPTKTTCPSLLTGEYCMDKLLCLPCMSVLIKILNHYQEVQTGMKHIVFYGTCFYNVELSISVREQSHMHCVHQVQHQLRACFHTRLTSLITYVGYYSIILFCVSPGDYFTEEVGIDVRSYPVCAHTAGVKHCLCV